MILITVFAFDNESSQVECPICTRLRLLRLLLLLLPNLHRLGRFEVCNSDFEFSPQSAHHLTNVPSSVHGVLAHIPKRYEKIASPPCWDVSPACGGRSCCLVTREKVVKKPCVPFADVCMKSACLLKSHVPTRMKRALCTKRLHSTTGFARRRSARARSGFVAHAKAGAWRKSSLGTCIWNYDCKRIRRLFTQRPLP